MKINKKHFIIGGIIIFFIIISLWTFLKPGGIFGKIKVTASFYPLYFFAQQIAAHKADITIITPAGSEPHDYEPTAKDLVNIEKSRLIFINGLGLEPWGKNIEKNINKNHTKLVVLGEGLANLIIDEDGNEIFDPHVWLSPLLAKQMADKIKDAFIEVDPDNKQYYELSTTALKLKLDILNEQYKSGLSNCAKRDIVVSHSAFNYLTSAYGLNQLPISGLSPENEPSPHELIEITDFVRQKGLKYIFFESLASPKLAETLARETGIETLELNPLEGLTPKEISEGKNYFTVMEKNLENLRKALECK